MGSRILIKLCDLTQNPNVKVELSTSVEIIDADNTMDDSNAKVTFESENESFLYNFDYTVYQNQITLEADFNWFRYPADAPQVKLMRCLYENSVSFTVHH